MPSPIVQIRIPQELLDQAKAQAEADRRSFSAWVRLLIEDRLRGGVAAAEALQVISRFAESRLDGDRDDRSEDFRALVRIRDHSNKALGILPDETPTDQASVAQQAEQPAFNRKRAGSNPARGTGKGSPAANRSSQAANETGTKTSTVRNPAESPSRPIKCVCGGVILQDGPKAGKCTKCAKPKEAK